MKEPVEVNSSSILADRETDFCLDKVRSVEMLFYSIQTYRMLVDGYSSSFRSPDLQGAYLSHRFQKLIHSKHYIPDNLCLSITTLLLKTKRIAF